MEELAVGHRITWTADRVTPTRTCAARGRRSLERTVTDDAR